MKLAALRIPLVVALVCLGVYTYLRSAPILSVSKASPPPMSPQAAALHFVQSTVASNKVCGGLVEELLPLLQEGEEKLQGTDMDVISSSALTDLSLTSPDLPLQAKQAMASLLQADQYLVIEIEERPDMADLQDAFKELTGGSSVPRVFVGGKFLGGGDDTARMAENGELKQLLQAEGVLYALSKMSSIASRAPSSSLGLANRSRHAAALRPSYPCGKQVRHRYALMFTEQLATMLSQAKISARRCGITASWSSAANLPHRQSLRTQTQRHPERSLRQRSCELLRSSWSLAKGMPHARAVAISTYQRRATQNFLCQRASTSRHDSLRPPSFSLPTIVRCCLGLGIYQLLVCIEQALPDDYVCPICGAAKDKFESSLTVVAGFAANQRYGLGSNSMTEAQKSLLIYGALGTFFLLFILGYALN
ncbi:hypothetical protein QJQ45_025320 [Haematococcus lacustris]|nr:hypothetical protein QJQ45_025320 [Haematococcus lacustris]